MAISRTPSLDQISIKQAHFLQKNAAPYKLKNTVNDRRIKGPDFLPKPPSKWINLPKHSTELSADDPEVKLESKSLKVNVRLSEIQSNVISLVQRFSSWLKLLKLIAVCLRCQVRFIARKRKSKQDGFDRSSQTASLEPLTCSEINDAEREVIMFDQRRAFAEERKATEKGDCVKKSSVLAKLDLGGWSSSCRWKSK